MSCGADAWSTWRAPETARTNESPLKYDAAPMAAPTASATIITKNALARSPPIA